MSVTTLEMNHFAIGAPATPRPGVKPHKRADEFQSALDRYLADYRACQMRRLDVASSPRLRDAVPRLLKTVWRAAL